MSLFSHKEVLNLKLSCIPLQDLRISKDDEIVFTYSKRTYTAVSKVLLITK
ncbi:MAG TPA: hypothetical protein PLC04_05585 [Candidatus Kapabacteria bacterium]|nr:hypothetical protein [Candidatus Kapabacteria bacterium]HOV92528.1 hypothetical protein [Candidatus Kapabacteria bacterium]